MPEASPSPVDLSQIKLGQLYSTVELSPLVGMTVAALSIKCRSQEIVSQKVGPKWLVKGSDLFKWLGIDAPTVTLHESGRDYPELPEDVSEIAPYRVYPVPYIEHALQPAISQDLIYNAIKAGRLKAIKVGRRRFLLGSSVLKWLDFI